MRTVQRTAGLGLAALVTVLAFALISTLAFAQTPTPTVSVPASPSDSMFAGGVLTWTDNADNEDGFRITVEIRGDLTDEITVLLFEVEANVTSFARPPEAEARCPDRTSVLFTVVAFNAAGESKSVGLGIALICPAAPTPSPTVSPTIEPTLPQTGMRGGSESRFPFVWLLVPGAGLLALGGAGWRARRSERLRRDDHPAG